MAAAKKPDEQVLPSKDMAVYREIGKAFDERQYKQALKKADGLLKKYPNHGDTNAMKALTLNALGKKSEALDLAKSALRMNIRSHVCWQILGMLQKAQQNHPEAVKAFRQAWKLDPENFQIARDLAVVQLHLRDYQGSLETRQALLAQKINTNFNMLAFGYAHALAGNVAFASVVLDKTEIPGAPPAPAPGAFPPASNASDDLALYKLQLAEAAGDAKRALTLTSSPSFNAAVVDRTNADEHRAALQLESGQATAAAASYWSLLQTNPDNLEYAAGLLQSVLGDAGHAVPAVGRLDTDLRAVAVARSMQEGPAANVAVAAILVAVAANPRCRTLKRLLLDALPASHPLFRPCLASYIRSSVRKGIPSLFSDLRHLARPAHAAGMDWAQRAAQYKAAGSSPKGAVLLEVAQAYYSFMSTGDHTLATYAVDEASVASGLQAALASVQAAIPAAKAISLNLSLVTTDKGDGKADSPDVLPWTGLLLSRLQDELGDPQAGVATLDAAMGHTPTVIDLLMAKARMLKHAGKHEEAASTMDAARQLDSADRHVNNKAVEYMMRAGRIEDGEATEALFVRHDAASPEDPLAHMRALQVSWYDLALGAAYEARRDYGPALVAYHRCLESQEGFVEDGMDYHVYCLRNFWLRTHHSMLAVNQSMGQHSTTLRAAEGLARCYLALHRDASLRVPKDVTERPTLALPPKDDKAKDKPKKEEKKKDEDEEEGEKKPAFDPWGAAHLANANPLESARKYARLLVEGVPGGSSASAALVESASGKGRVPVRGAGIQEPSVIAGGRAAGWRSGVGMLARMHMTAAEVEVAAGKASQTTAAVALAKQEAATEGSGVDAQARAQLQVLQQGLATLLASAPGPVQETAKHVPAA